MELEIKPGDVLLAPIANRDPESILSHPTLWAFATVEEIFTMSNDRDYPDDVVTLIRTNEAYLCPEDIDPHWVFESHPFNATN